MKEIHVETVFGDYWDNPELQTVKELFYNRTLQEWDNGNEVSIISYDDDSNSSSISIVAHKDYGLALIYSSLGEDDFMLTNGQDTKQIVQVGIGDGYVFQKQFVSRETAWKAVEYFMQTGKRLETLNWQAYEVPDVAPEAYTA